MITFIAWFVLACAVGACACFAACLVAFICSALGSLRRGRQ